MEASLLALTGIRRKQIIISWSPQKIVISSLEQRKHLHEVEKQKFEAQGFRWYFGAFITTCTATSAKNWLTALHNVFFFAMSTKNVGEKREKVAKRWKRWKKVEKIGNSREFQVGKVDRESKSRKTKRKWDYLEACISELAIYLQNTLKSH